MRSIRLGLAALLAVAALVPTGALAASKGDPMQAMMLAKAREKGMADAPAVVQASGAKCTVSDARWIGEDKKSGTNFYETACKEGLGYVFIAKKDDPAPQSFTCLEANKPQADGKPSSLQCLLPANANPEAGLKPFIDKTGSPCAIDKARAIGQGQKNSYFEVACKNGAGYILVTSSPPDPAQDVQLNTCLAYEPSDNLACQLTDRAKVLALVDNLVTKSTKPCTVTGRRFVLSTVKGDTYVEVACSSGSGYIMQENRQEELVRAYDCAQADFIAGGCTLTDARASQTEQAALYSKLATKAGFNCDVQKYASLPTTGAKEIIELACKNRPDGAIGIFTASSGRLYDCVRAEALGYRCSFTKQSAVYPKLTGDLKKLGKGSCEVSDARSFGATTDEDLIEVGCADGDPGWVLGYAKDADGPKEALSCLQAASFGTGGCRLPTNRKH